MLHAWHAWTSVSVCYKLNKIADIGMNGSMYLTGALIRDTFEDLNF